MDEAEALYGLPLDRFTPERDALARRLRDAGDRAGADAVKALRKPSVPAWAVNQILRRHPEDVAALYAAGDALGEAHRTLLSGGDAAAVREATAREREAVNALAATARPILEEAGLGASAATLEKVTETLSAIAVPGEARERALGKMLDRELRRAGLGDVAGLRVVPDAAPVRSESGAERAARKQAERDAKRRALEREREIAALVREADEADAQAYRLEKDAEKARARAADARRRVERLRAGEGAE